MNLYNELVNRNESHLDRPAASLITREGSMLTMTYGEIIEGVNRYYDILKESGDYRKGDRIGICAKASPDWHQWH